ncbi:hypothetical protein OAG71_02065 [bacterium]|nr:hypothetical protein [bacterium]
MIKFRSKQLDNPAKKLTKKNDSIALVGYLLNSPTSGVSANPATAISQAKANSGTYGRSKS